MKDLPPKSIHVVVVTHEVAGQTFRIWARGESEVECLCKLAKREPDGRGICPETHVSTGHYMLPRPK